MAKSRLLVTGATGFVGWWTLRHWREKHPETEIWATSEKPQPSNIEADQYRQVDLRNPQAVEETVFACRPTQVIHLASLIGKATLADYLSVNVVGTDNLYQALAQTGSASDLRIVQAGSAAIYGMVCPDELPINENQPPRPVTAYALSKLTQQYLASAMCLQHGLEIMTACIFNILGPNQPDTLVPMTFVKQLVDIRSGRTDRLKVGQTASRRDFVDIRDVVEGFDALLKRGKAGETYNIASGKDVSIQEILEMLFEIAGLDAPIETSSARLRNVDVPCVRADCTKITDTTGWKPKFNIRDSLKILWSSACD